MKKQKKRGHTLTEVLITLAVVGVVAGTLLPMVNKFRPDSVKIKYLQTYDAIKNLVSDLAENHTLFPAVLVVAGRSYNTYGFPFINEQNTTFCQSFVGGLNVANMTEADIRTACTGANPSVVDFEGKDGVAWRLTTERSIAPDVFLSTAEVWLNGDRTDNTQHFTFQIGADGEISIRDQIGLSYLETRSSWRRVEDRVLPPLEQPINPNITLTSL